MSSFSDLQFFTPKSIAVIGVSKKPGVGETIFSNIRDGYRGKVRMVGSIKSIKLLKGVRGEKPSDSKAIVDNLQRLSQLITDFPEIEEFDINPLMILKEGKGALTVEVREGLKEEGHAPS
ncbi:MAG: acetate--CoA ligase family protein [Nitrososphaeraceae archaeon]